MLSDIGQEEVEHFSKGFNCTVYDVCYSSDREKVTANYMEQHTELKKLLAKDC